MLRIVALVDEPLRHTFRKLLVDEEPHAATMAVPATWAAA